MKRLFSHREKTLFWLFAGLAAAMGFINGYYVPFLRESRLAGEKYEILQRKVRVWEEDMRTAENIKERFPQWTGQYVARNTDAFSEETRRVLQDGARQTGLLLEHIDLEQKTEYPSRLSAQVQVKGTFPPMAQFLAFLRQEAPFLEIDEIKFSRPSYAQDSLVCEMRVSRTFFTEGGGRR